MCSFPANTYLLIFMEEIHSCWKQKFKLSLLSFHLHFSVTGKEQKRTVAWSSSCHFPVTLQMADIWKVHLLHKTGTLLHLPFFLDRLYSLLNWKCSKMQRNNCSFKWRGWELCRIHILDKHWPHYYTGISVLAYTFWGRW